MRKCAGMRVRWVAANKKFAMSGEPGRDQPVGLRERRRTPRAVQRMLYSFILRWSEIREMPSTLAERETLP